jgi:hypothetical protein
MTKDPLDGVPRDRVRVCTKNGYEPLHFYFRRLCDARGAVLFMPAQYEDKPLYARVQGRSFALWSVKGVDGKYKVAVLRNPEFDRRKNKSA